MSSRNRRASEKHKSQSTVWSEWTWDEARQQYYRYRYDKYGHPEYEFHEPKAASYGQPTHHRTGYKRDEAEREYPEVLSTSDNLNDESEDIPFGGPGYINPNCLCGNNCRAGTGCDPSTVHGGPGTGTQHLRRDEHVRTSRKAKGTSRGSYSAKDRSPSLDDEYNSRISETQPRTPYPATYASSFAQATQYSGAPILKSPNSNVNPNYMHSSVPETYPASGYPASSYIISGNSSPLATNVNYIANSTYIDLTIPRSVAPEGYPGLSSAFAGLSIDGRINPETGENSYMQQDSTPPYSSSFSISDFPPDGNQGTVFGRICDEMGLTEYGNSEGESNEVSRWNPEGLRNNCIFVSVGYCLNLTAQELAQYLDVKFPPHINGLGVGEMEWHLGRMPGLHVVVLPFNNWAFNKKPHNSLSFALRFLKPWTDQYGESPFAIGYQRKNRSGHCVVAERLSRGKLPYSYTCYQKRTNGTPITKDVEGSSIRFAIFVDRQSSAMKMDFYYETGVRNRFTHVRFEENGWYSNARHAPSSSSYSQAYPSSSSLQGYSADESS